MTPRRRGVAAVLLSEAEALYRQGIASTEARRRLAATNAASASPLPRRDVGEMVAVVWGLPRRQPGRMRS